MAGSTDSSVDTDKQYTLTVPDSVLVCSVCQNSPLLLPVVGSCGHTLCEECHIKGNLKRCPECRKDTNFVPLFMLRNLLQHLPEYQHKLTEQSVEHLKDILAQKFGELKEYRSNFAERDERMILQLLTQYKDNQEFANSFLLTFRTSLRCLDHTYHSFQYSVKGIDRNDYTLPKAPLYFSVNTEHLFFIILYHGSPPFLK